LIGAFHLVVALAARLGAKYVPCGGAEDELDHY